MNDLARTLASFPGAAELLVLLRPEVAATLVDLLPPMRTLLGGVAAPRSHGHEPAGLGDLATRGRYDRLLLSEWLLASEAPEEFDRRAAMGEHLFLAPERQGPARPVRTVVLFDAGPSQLGRPRIVQLASLLAFAMRARSARVPLVVGSLQDGLPLRPPDIDAFVALVTARSFEPASPDDLARRGPFSADDDLWVVGGPDLAAPRDSKRLVLIDDEDGVQLAVQRPGQSVVRRMVPVPATRGALLALRDPRRRVAASATIGASPDEIHERLGNALHPTAPFHFTSAGRHLLGRLPGGAIIAHRLRTSPRDPSQLRYRLRAPEGEISLLGEQSRRGPGLLTMAGDQLTLHLLGKRGGGRGESFSYEAPPATIFRGPVAPRLLLPRLDATRAVFLDAEGRLWRLPTTSSCAGVLAWDVEAVVENLAGFVMAERFCERPEGLPDALRFTHVTRVPPNGALPNEDGKRGPGSWERSLSNASFVAWGGAERALCRLPDESYVIATSRGEAVPVSDADDLACHGFAGWRGSTIVASRGDEVLLLEPNRARRVFAHMPATIVRIVAAIGGRHLAAEDVAGHVHIFNESAELVLALCREPP